MILQNIIFEKLDCQSDNELFYRKSDSLVYSSLEKQTLTFQKHGKVFFDTYYNSFPVKPWRKNCNLNDLSLQLNGSGKFLLQVGHHQKGLCHKFLCEQIVDLDNPSNELIVPIDNIDGIEGGIIYFALIALSDAIFSGGAYITNAENKGPIKLGIVITHFNRKAYVVPAIKRIQEQLVNSDECKGKVELFVIDNSQNITEEESCGANIVPNLNLGGSGGFTRGLKILQDSGRFTHCLFMDDDASCEIDSIKRAINFLELSDTKKQAVSGGLLRELEPWRLIEKGAKFDSMARPFNHGLDMRDLGDLLKSSDNQEKPNYGAWWFFMFKISDVEHYPFPFFVRGDDIQFSLLNKFNIETFNGISCYGDDFGLKSSPMTRYLDTRHTMIQNVGVEDKNFITVFKNILRFYFVALFSYNYDSARAATYAVKDFLKGEEFWLDNMDMSAVRKRFADEGFGEQMVKVDLHHVKPVYCHRGPESKLRTFLRFATLQGHLLPSLFDKKSTIYQFKQGSANLAESFRYNEILYYYDSYATGYLAKMKRARCFKELLFFVKTMVLFTFKFNKSKSNYKKSVSNITTKAFWDKVYKDEK